MKSIVVCFLVALLFSLSACLKFSLPALPENYIGNRRCIILNFGLGELITGMVKSDKSFGTTSAFRTNAWIEDSVGNKHWQKYDLSGETRFAFKTHTQPLTYQCCVVNELNEGSMFKNPPTSDIEVLAENALDLFDEGLAHTMMVKPIEKDIINIEPVLKHIVQQLDELYETERLMRDINESTNGRVRFLSIMTILALVVLSLFQLYYLKRYFKLKKLI